ncbi:MAG: integrase core domain-containing protein [Rhodobacterales bacterium]
MCYSATSRASSINDWIGFYNKERPHTALDKRSPDDAFFDTERTQKAA